MDKLKPLKYFLAAVLLWVVVDLGTAGGFQIAYLQKYGWVLFLFYLGYPAVFTWLVFRAKLSDLKLLAATAVGIFVVEVLFTHNPWLMSFPLLLAGIPLAVAVYVPLTFFPLWWIRGELGRRKRLVVPLAIVELSLIIITTFGAR